MTRWKIYPANFLLKNETLIVDKPSELAAGIRHESIPDMLLDCGACAHLSTAGVDSCEWPMTGQLVAEGLVWEPAASDLEDSAVSCQKQRPLMKLKILQGRTLFVIVSL